MLLREAIEKIGGLRYMIEKLDLQSGLAKRSLYTSPYLKTVHEIQSELDKIDTLYNFLANPAYNDFFSTIRLKLGQIKDIRGTVSRIEKKHVLNDIELFELKAFSLLSGEISLLLKEKNINVVHLPELEDIVDILDPDKVRIPHFYIYDSYSADLAVLRKHIKELKQNKEDKLAEEKYFESVELEDKIRETLSGKINKYASDIYGALADIARLDILLAKAQQSIDMDLCKPVIAQSTIVYKSIFNPQIKAVLRERKKDFQAVDLKIDNSPSLITGANMAGKTVLLKTVALSQILFQFGFYIPAESAEIFIVDEVLLSIEDRQDELSGLSSFAAEMLQIDNIIRQVKSGKRILVLVDELARTTNPVEGKAIVSAMLDFLTEYKVPSMVTTHYSGIKTSVRKLRVKGFIEENIKGELTIDNINQYIDYSLVEDNQNTVPQEGIRIARILGVDNELLDKVDNYLE